jgi:predicted nucleic acid-binding protein
MMTPRPIIVVDTDALIGLFYEHDAHATEAYAIAQKLQSCNAKLLYPATTLVETITTLQRKMHRPDLVKQVVHLIEQTPLDIEPVDTTTLSEALALFSPDGSKQDTLFDAIVATIATKQAARAIFSFDAWYEKRGFTLARDVV